jgi:hypothetical protein
MGKIMYEATQQKYHSEILSVYNKNEKNKLS